MAEFDLSALLGDVSKLDTGADGGLRLEYIDVGLIDPDPENRKDLKNIDKLAQNIALVGLQQPLAVRKNPDAEGRYVVVSGHRRRLAIKSLVEDGEEKFRRVPCLVGADGDSPAMIRLKLLSGNVVTQGLTSVEMAEVAEKMGKCICELKEEGHEFSGKVRDYVAEILNVSSSKLGRLKVIREKILEPRFENEWKSGDLSEQQAYALAQMPPIMQTTIAELCAGKPTPPGWKLEEIKGKGMDHYLTTPAQCPDGEGCTNGRRFLAHDVDPKDYSPCPEAGCCMNCYHASTCRHLCPKAKAKVSADRARTRAAGKREKELTKKRDAAIKDFWRGFGQRLAVACEGDKDIYRAATREMADMAGAETVVSWQYALELMAFDQNPHYKDCALVPRGLAALCLQLNVSADYLLGLSDDPLTKMTKEVSEGE